MCFGPIASFTSGIILITIGGLALRYVRAKNSIPFASIPVFFGIQQIIEGFVWLSFGGSPFHTLAVYAFLMFSHVFWPIFVPVSIWLIETDPRRKKILGVISVIGIIIGVTLFSGIVIGPVTAGIVHHSINYTTPVWYPLLSFSLYLIATCGGSMISSSLKIRIFGSIMLVSFFIAHAFYPETFFSVWCFFAAVLSVIIYVHMRDLRAIIKDIKD